VRTAVLEKLDYNRAVCFEMSVLYRLLPVWQMLLYVHSYIDAIKNIHYLQLVMQIGFGANAWTRLEWRTVTPLL
jgi:hypothetical protein